MDRVRVKICCIMSVEEAWRAIRAGASALGLVSAMPSGPGVIPESRIAEIAAVVPSWVDVFLLTSRRTAVEIIDQRRRLGVDTVQICDSVTEATYAAIRDAMPDLGLVQVVHVNGPEAVAEAERIAPHVDALLLDSGDPKGAVKQLGGTGRRHDWGISRRIVEAVDVPVYLAGGLNPDNADQAIAQVAPFALDVCSGVRTDGHLDPDKLDAFFKAVRSRNRTPA